MANTNRIENVIDAKQTSLEDLLSRSSEIYLIPEYQRPYEWTQNQWEELYEDISILGEDEIHFMGSFVVIPEGFHRFGVNSFYLVDGQQRLATIMVWLSAIRDVIRDEDPHIADHISNKYLFVESIENGKIVKIPKLKLGKLDNDVFQKILSGKVETDNESFKNHLLIKCYYFFKDKAKSNDKDLELWTRLIKNVYVVHINVVDALSAFRLFETLNDRGLALSAMDLIKNFILMKISDDENYLSEAAELWEDMYINIRDKEPDKFLRRFLLSNYEGKVSQSKVFEKVKNLLQNKTKKDIIEFVKELDHYSDIYRKIIDAEDFGSKKIQKRLKELNYVEVSPSFTLLMKVMDLYGKGNISEESVLKIMDMIEVFHIRWGICGQTTSKLDDLYNKICMEVKNGKNIYKAAKDSIEKMIKDYVDDITFIKNFEKRSFKTSENRTKYILWKLSEPTGETVIDMEEVHIEHIMPKNLSKWLDYLKNKTGKSEGEIKNLHGDYLNRIGNLTLIKGKWNISISNNLFDKKKKQYEESEFSITRELSTYKEWTFKNIDERSKNFAEKAWKIWKIED